MENQAHRSNAHVFVRWFMPPVLETQEATERALTLWKLSWGTLAAWLAAIVLLPIGGSMWWKIRQEAVH